MKPEKIAPVLTARDVWKTYADAPVLRGVNLSLAPGERVALMGPSGSGKSTLLHCLAGIDRPDRGEIRLDGKYLADLENGDLTQIRRTKISLVFQFFHLLPTLTAEENVAFPMKLQGCSRCEIDQRVSALIADSGLESRKNAYPTEMSGGEQQRVAIARALATRPRVILADEPTGSLDSKTSEAILDLLARLTEGTETALLLVTHDEATTRVCSRTLHMNDGQISC